MVARVQSHSGGLLVTFFRDGESPDQQHARDGRHAAAVAITAITTRLVLMPGDTVTVRRDDGRPEPDDQPPDLPEPNRSSQYS
jgi:hypothetical protein